MKDTSNFINFDIQKLRNFCFINTKITVRILNLKTPQFSIINSRNFNTFLYN